MKSVGNISKITSAMKMVAASRLRGAQTRVEASRGIWVPGTKLMGDVPGEWSSCFTCSLLPWLNQPASPDHPSSPPPFPSARLPLLRAALASFAHQM